MNISFNSDLTNMTSLKARRQKFGIGSLIIMIIIGGAFLVPGYLFTKSTKISKGWVQVPGKVVSVSNNTHNGSTTYTPDVTYTVNGQTYDVTSSFSSGSYPQIGSTKEVAYNPAQPGESKVVAGAGEMWFVYLFPIIGIVMVVLAPWLFVRSIRRSHDINSLLQTGQKIQGVLTDVLTTGQSNNSTTYKMVVSATNLSGSVQTYTSDTIHGIAGITLAHFQNNPIPIDVYINPSNPKDYYVDISDIPTLTPEKITELLQTALHRQPNTFAQGEQPNSLSPPANPAPPTPPTPPISPAPPVPPTPPIPQQ